MSVYSVNNPLSNGYGVNVYSLKKKLEEETKEESLLDTLMQKTALGKAMEEEEEKKKTNSTLEELTASVGQNDNLAEQVEIVARQLGITGKITYTKLLAHKDEISASFTETVKQGLQELGVDPNADFRLSLDEDGAIKVSSNHKDKAKIEQFFKENPQLAETYNQIQTLNQVEEARKMGGKNINDNYEKNNLLSYMNKTGLQSALAMTGEGSLATLLNTGFNLTI